MLNLAEELLLLALEDESGRVVPAASSALDYGLAGAALMELVLSGRLGMEERRLMVVDGSPTGDWVLDGLLDRVGGSRKSRSVEHWVNILGTRNLRWDLLDELVDKGVLERESRRVLWIIPQTRHPARDDAPELEVRARVRAAVLAGERPEPRVAALIGLIKACDLAEEVFSSGERRYARERLAEISSDEMIGRAVSETVAGVQAGMQVAMMASVTAAATTAAASSS
ncbi:MAG: GPP34 family phosphoprotein [Actinomycetota bacterium]